MDEARNNNFLLDVLLDFVLVSIPLTLTMEFIFYRLFHCLFNIEISKYLRPYSFCWILLEMTIQNNIEYFTFVGFRAFDIPFSFTLASTIVQGFTICFMFIVLVTTITSYLFYYYHYGKMARYFLSNMYRFKSSYVLMTITFGVRPFLKGLVHAKFFDNWNLQIWLLIGIELTIMIIIIFF